jgi:L-seryl-tRNA(Ser) seleniumtransferase
MISMSESELAARAEKWRDAIGAGSVERARSTVGGGSLPGQTLPTSVLIIEPRESAYRFAASLRNSPVAVIARIVNDRILLDPRTVFPVQDDAVIEAVKLAIVSSVE